MSTLGHTQRRWFMFRCLLPACLLYLFWVVVPACQAFYYALTNWDGLTEPQFVGLANFCELFAQANAFGRLFREHSITHIITQNLIWETIRSDLFLIALTNNFFLMFWVSLLTLSLALFFAAALRQKVPGAGFFRVTFFFPNILSAVAISVLWLLLYSTSSAGLINWVLLNLGFIQEPYAFTDSSVLIRWVVPMIVWTSTGFYMLLFFAAMQSIPDSLYEAAFIDGANAVDSFFHVTLPMIWDTVVTALVFMVIAGLKIFDSIWVIEQQQARRDSNTIATLMYSKIFNEYDIGLGTAIAVLLFLGVLVLALVTLKLARRESLEY